MDAGEGCVAGRTLSAAPLLTFRKNVIAYGDLVLHQTPHISILFTFSILQHPFFIMQYCQYIVQIRLEFTLDSDADLKYTVCNEYKVGYMNTSEAGFKKCILNYFMKYCVHVFFSYFRHLQ